MNKKNVHRLNRKMLKDAREYLELTQQLGRIQKAVTINQKDLSQQQLDFIKGLEPLMEQAIPVVEEVLRVTKALEELPSSAHLHTRRKVVVPLNELLFDRANHMHEIIQTILTSATLFAMDDTASPTESEPQVIGGTTDE